MLFFFWSLVSKIYPSFLPGGKKKPPKQEGDEITNMLIVGFFSWPHKQKLHGLFLWPRKKLFKYRKVHRLISLIIPVHLHLGGERLLTCSHSHFESFFLITEVKYYKVEVLFHFLISSSISSSPQRQVITTIISVNICSPHFQTFIQKYALLHN